MKIIHTADIHLTQYGDERWEALQRLITIGKQEGIELFVVSGDLFDHGVDAEALRPRIRELFSDTGFKICLIPGNHDSASYTGGMYFGEDAVIITDLNKPYAYKDVMIWGIPFESADRITILHRLRSIADRMTPDKKHIMLYHGELLDAFYSRTDFGAEGDERYMPVRLSYFNDLPIDYVLAGHFHRRFDVRQLEGGGYFVYPGSPISITKKETGRRRVNLFELGTPPREYPLDTPHFADLVIVCDPFAPRDPLEQIREDVSAVHESARILLTVTGFINGEALGMTEEELVQGARKILGKRCVQERYEFQDIRTILEDDLFKGFWAKLEQADYGEEKKEHMRQIALRAMMEARR